MYFINKQNSIRWTQALMLSAMVTSLSVSAPAVAAADEASADTAATQPEAQTPEQVAAQKDAEASAKAKTLRERENLFHEAVDAVRMTQKAFDMLGEAPPKKNQALEELEKAVGKLEVLIARDPRLAMVPIDVSSEVRNVVAKTEDVQAMIDQAWAALDDGRVQDARAILNHLASEFVVTTTSLPLATYPDAIKTVVPLIDAGEIDKAREQVQRALNLMVIKKDVYPLPLMRANSLLASAEKLTGKTDRSGADNAQLSYLLKEARREVKFGQILGYYDDLIADPLYDQIDQIESKTQDGGSGTGYYEQLKSMLSDLF